SSGTIGIYVPDFSGPFYGPLLDAIDAELRLHGRHMVAANGCGKEDTRQQALDGARFLVERGCDGVIMNSNALRDGDFLKLLEEGDFSAPSGWAAAERLLARKPEVSALFCANDQMAMGAMSLLQSRGVSVPGDWSVLGYDDSDVAAYLAPRLSCVHIPIADMG